METTVLLCYQPGSPVKMCHKMSWGAQFLSCKLVDVKTCVVHKAKMIGY